MKHVKNMLPEKSVQNKYLCIETKNIEIVFLPHTSYFIIKIVQYKKLSHSHDNLGCFSARRSDVFIEFDCYGYRIAFSNNNPNSNAI